MGAGELKTLQIDGEQRLETLQANAYVRTTLSFDTLTVVMLVVVQHGCTPCAAGLEEEADARLEQESAALLAAVDAQLCAQRQPCSGLSGDAHRAMDTAKTGGAATSAAEPSPDVIAAGRCDTSADPVPAHRSLKHVCQNCQDPTASTCFPG